MSFVHFKKAGKYFILTTLGRNHYLPALLKNNEDKILRLTITLLHILCKSKNIRQGIKSNLSKLMIFASYQ